ncbi:hypothetical protein EMIHUDRAFT_208340 [Emiliania huxleyi CCMP1516]|uniref:Methyltransferase domain-containing protein n=2 Tax=Emiliania huxleyi TaxID=2903 RepID=A0A0D3JAD9_EMIH1|nr:hypothetical protein EMIHUDRAFT_208340 [Emiliania huxleyi CCMP1516]EOD20474.1 hypothetical protein EMIHUDRAFT_208340 [Emiliania huxleyi CCMP1516]|eukprot:XP_005772903.1 hypothetical protein EMIHUDRAFT_208340 [Emiliania huxleyi CCMP1516]
MGAPSESANAVLERLVLLGKRSALIGSEPPGCNAPEGLSTALWPLAVPGHAELRLQRRATGTEGPHEDDGDLGSLRDGTGYDPGPRPACAMRVCAFLANAPSSNEPLRLLELGAGIGTCGLFFASRIDGRASVVLSDCDPEALRLARLNAASLDARDASRVAVRRYVWGQPLDSGFDVVLSSDSVYTRSQAAPFFKACKEAARHDDGRGLDAVVIMSHCVRRPTVFGDASKAAGAHGGRAQKRRRVFIESEDAALREFLRLCAADRSVAIVEVDDSHERASAEEIRLYVLAIAPTARRRAELLARWADPSRLAGRGGGAAGGVRRPRSSWRPRVQIGEVYTADTRQRR